LCVVVGLFVVPLPLLAVLSLVMVLLFHLLMRRELLKAAFNASSFVVGTLLAGGAAHLVAGDVGGPVLSSRDAVGLALAGFVDTRSGTHRADPAPGAPSVPLAAGVAERLRLPVQIEDMARAAALAEARRGAAAGVADVLFLSLGDRVGAALILDGNLYRGATGVVGEIGHVVVREDGPRCTCGNLGCVQALASRPAILRQVEDGLAGGVVSTIRAPSTVDRPLDLPEVVEAAAQGDRLAISVLRQAGQDIGRALAAGTNLLGPTMVVLGGQAPHLGEVFVDEVRRVLASHVVSPIWERLRVATSQLGPSAAALGAAWGALDQLIDSGAVVRHAGRHRLRKRDRLAAAR
ncbi:MAG TPA: ROK family protein, partial [Chloroflexota bacterium]|nr:ROK family protein [Chloroflexota bacterium]